MQINLNGRVDALHNQRVTAHIHSLHSHEKMDKKEKIARKELVRIWMRLLEEFARPGAMIPPMHEVRRILENEGVHAATEAIKKEYWYISRKKIEKEVRKNVKRGLASPELDAFVEEVKRAQRDQSLIPGLRNHIYNYIMHGF